MTNLQCSHSHCPHHSFTLTADFDPAPSQEITRANKGWALDRMVLCNEVTRWMKDDVTQPPAEGVYVYGLHLEGAGWDRRSCKLVDSKPKVLFEMMPVIRMYAENNGEGYSQKMNAEILYSGRFSTVLPVVCLRLNLASSTFSIPHSHSEWMDVTFKCQAD